MTEHCQKLPRYMVESSSPEILKSHMDTVLSNWLQVALLEQEVWTRQCPDISSKLSYSVVLMCVYIYIYSHSQILSSNMKLTVKSSYVQQHLKPDNINPPFLNMLVFHTIVFCVLLWLRFRWTFWQDQILCQCYQQINENSVFNNSVLVTEKSVQHVLVLEWRKT